MWGCISNSSSVANLNNGSAFSSHSLLSRLVCLNLWKDTTGHQMSVGVNAKFFMQSPYLSKRQSLYIYMYMYKKYYQKNQPTNNPLAFSKEEIHIDWRLGHVICPDLVGLCFSLSSVFFFAAWPEKFSFGQKISSWPEVDKYKWLVWILVGLFFYKHTTSQTAS
jgi:hypothetical protein